MIMKRFLISVLLYISLLPSLAQATSSPLGEDWGEASALAHYMAPGWNLGNTLEGGSNANCFTNNGGLSAETLWQPTKTTKAVIDLVKASGFKSVRIPCSWIMGHVTDMETLTIDPSWLARVKEIVDWCIEDSLFVILNEHWDGGWLEYDGFTTGADVDAKKEQLRKIWTNIATAFRDYDYHLLFAGMNEPGVGGASPDASGSLMVSQYSTDTDENEQAFADRILEYDQVFVDAVRATGGNNAQRVLVVQGPKVNATNTAKSFDVSKLRDTAIHRLMVEVHHYAPYAFCQMTEDTDWGKVKYYWNGHSPRRASSDRIGSASEQSATQDAFNALKAAFVDKGYPVIVGEYGALARTLSSTQGNQTSHNESRQYWYNFSTDYAMSAGCIPFCWDINNTGYHIIDRANVKVGDTYDLNGIMEGAASAIKAYNTIYPAASSSSGICTISTDVKRSEYVYDLSGRVVGTSLDGLPHGIFVYKGKKVKR